MAKAQRMNLYRLLSSAWILCKTMARTYLLKSLLSNQSSQFSTSPLQTGLCRSIRPIPRSGLISRCLISTTTREASLRCEERDPMTINMKRMETNVHLHPRDTVLSLQVPIFRQRSVSQTSRSSPGSPMMIPTIPHSPLTRNSFSETGTESRPRP